jgi:small-conductance mechanosensitive channel
VQSDVSDLKRALLPANSLTNWLMIGFSTLSCLRIFGLDPSPLLTVGSVSGIVVGFASQNLLLNLISGISIFLTRPFVVGDIVCVKNGAITVAQGTISSISPLRTSFIDDSANTVTLPNKMLSDMVITNYRKQKASLVRTMGSCSVVIAACGHILLIV